VPRGETYELKGNAPSFLATDGNVEEAASALCNVSVSVFLPFSFGLGAMSSSKSCGCLLVSVIIAGIALEVDSQEAVARKKSD
jgi:hypothetical protein